MDLHERIAQALGWTVQQTQSLSLAALRDLVRPVSQKLAAEISNVIQSGGHLTRNTGRYYVWAVDEGGPVEGPWGPYETLESAKTFARIGATEGRHDRMVSIGSDPLAASFEIVRWYVAGSGERRV